VSNGNNFVAGFYASADFTLTAPPGSAADLTATLTDIPREIQEEVGVWSAMQDAHPTLTDNEQWALFRDINKRAADKIEEIGTANKSQVSGANSTFQPTVSQIEHIGTRGW
jgi:hypothetical protein